MNDVYLAFKESRDSEDHLEHHGIKGQKWGVRRFQNPDGTRIGAKKRKPAKEDSEKKEKAHKDYKEDADTLSDEELQKRIKRMENELKYRNQQKLLYPDKHKARKEFVKKVFVDSFQQAAAEAMKTAYAEMGKRVLKSIGILKDNNNNNSNNNNNDSNNSNNSSKKKSAKQSNSSEQSSSNSESNDSETKKNVNQKSEAELNREKKWREQQQNQAERQSRTEELINSIIRANEQRQSEARAQKEDKRRHGDEEATRRAIENRNSSDAMNEYKRDKKLSGTEVFYMVNMPKKRRRG